MKEQSTAGFRQTKVEIDGITYTLQKMPFKSYLDMVDRHTNRNGVLMKSPYMADLFKHCVISPKVTMSTFDDDFGAANELGDEIESFLRRKSDQGTNTEKSEG